MPWPDSRDMIERGFERDLTAVFDALARRDLNEITEAEIEQAVADAATPWLDTTAEDALAALLLLLDDRLGVDALASIRQSLTVSGLVSTQTTAQILGRQVAANTRQMVERMRGENLRKTFEPGRKAPGSDGARGGLTPKQQETVFGRTRAGRIAVTETTRMAEIAERSAMDVLRRSGIAVRRRWATAADDRVCPICRPLDGLPDHQWPAAYRDGPPAHVNCRCTAEIINLDNLLN